jgi:hypothetical protein
MRIIIKVSSIFGTMSIVQSMVLSCIVMIAASAVVTPFLLLSSSSQSAFAQQASFDNPIPLDNGPGDQTFSHVTASSGNNVYVAYTSEINGQGSILFTRSTDRGASFSTPILVSTADTGFSFLDAIAANGNNVYVVWTGVTPASDIYLAKSTDGGATFSSPISITVESESNARNPVIAVSGDNVYVVWQDFRNAPTTLVPDIFFSASIDGGNTFSTAVDVSNTAGKLSKVPAITANGNNVYVVWIDCNPDGTNCRTLYTKSNNVGATFTTPVALNDPESGLSDIAVLGNTVYVVYGRSFLNSQNVQAP